MRDDIKVRNKLKLLCSSGPTATVDRIVGASDDEDDSTKYIQLAGTVVHDVKREFSRELEVQRQEASSKHEGKAMGKRPAVCRTQMPQAFRLADRRTRYAQ